MVEINYSRRTHKESRLAWMNVDAFIQMAKNQADLELQRTEAALRRGDKMPPLFIEYDGLLGDGIERMAGLDRALVAKKLGIKQVQVEVLD